MISGEQVLLLVNNSYQLWPPSDFIKYGEMTDGGL